MKKEHIDYFNILQNLWYEIEQEGYTALKKEHIPVILEYGNPEEMAALIVNGYSEPRKHGDKMLISEKKANKIAEKYSLFEDYCNALVLGDILDIFEKEFANIKECYDYNYTSAISFLKDYLERKHTTDFLNKMIESGDGKTLKMIKENLPLYNERIENSRRMLFESSNEYDLKIYGGKVIIRNLSKLQMEWKKVCQSIIPHGSVYKTYLKAVSRWIHDYDIIKCTPTNIILQISHMHDALNWDRVPYEFTCRYLKDIVSEGKIPTPEEQLLASFPGYDDIPIYQDLEERVYKSLQKELHDFKL